MGNKLSGAGQGHAYADRNAGSLAAAPEKKAGTPQQQKDEIEKASKSIMQQEDEGMGNDTLIGYRTPAAFRGKASFLVGMGRKLTEETI